MSRESALAKLAVFILGALFATLRLRVYDRSGSLAKLAGKPMIVCFWHNRILAITHAFMQCYPSGRGGVTVLTSPSRDGEILARVVDGFDMGAVRGSSSRRGARALRELIRLIEDGRDIAITPDGPRGPKYSLGPGAILLAQTSQTPILPVHASFGKAVQLKTWDGFTIPLPFSEISVTLDEPLSIPSSLTEEAFQEQRHNLEEILKNAAD